MKFPDTNIDRRAWELAREELMPMKNGLFAAGVVVERAQRHKDRLKGVQLKLGGGPLSYRAEGGNGSLVLCDRHLDARRAAGERWRLTGEAFKAELCDDCAPKEEV